MNDLPLICIQNVSFTYANGTRALKHVNLRINKGELIAIMGPNGAGKTTLIRLLNGLLRPTEGNVFIEGKNARNKTIAELSKKVGIIFQNPSHQLFSATVEQEIIFSLKNLGLNKEEIRTKKDEILHEFGFEKYKERSPLTLSGGEAKKLALASIVCRDPEIIVFDEPTLGQDAKEIEFFIKLIKE
ncbi:MAG: energy-coupling factor ABC transporter ATP-binding protein, partial [Promethearchaeota archaeon]